MLKDILLILLVHTHVGGHVRDDRLLIQVVTDHVRHEGVDHLVVGHAGTRCIGEANLAIAPGSHQTGHAQSGIGTEYLRVQEIVVNAAINHIHALQALDSTHVDTIIFANHQVGPFYQLGAHALSQEGMFKIGGVENTWREHRNFRVVLRPGRNRRQHVEQLVGVVIDRQNAGFVEQLREHPFGQLTVLQHVGNTRGDPQVVLKNIHLAIFIPHQVGSTDVRPDPQWRREPPTLLAKVLRVGEHIFGDDLVLDDVLVVVDVVDEHV